MYKQLFNKYVTRQIGMKAEPRDRAEVRKRILRSLTVKTEQKCGSGTSHLWKSLEYSLT